MNNRISRSVMTLIPCVYLTYKTCLNVDPFEMSSIVVVASCWLISIRLFGLIIYSKNQSIKLNLFLFQIFWIYFPLMKRRTNDWSIKSYWILFLLKYLFNHFIYNSFSSCQLENEYVKIVLFSLSLLTISFLYDLEIIIVRFLTKDEYTLQSFTNFPMFSLSLREFWGKRYNQLINQILKESIYEPIVNEYGYTNVVTLFTFIISGIYHIHIAFILSNDFKYFISTFIFFLLNGVICSIERCVNLNRYPRLIRCLITNVILLLTIPLVLRPFVEKGIPFLVVHPPPLSHYKWLPKFPSIDLCFS